MSKINDIQFQEFKMGSKKMAQWLSLISAVVFRAILKASVAVQVNSGLGLAWALGMATYEQELW